MEIQTLSAAHENPGFHLGDCGAHVLRICADARKADRVKNPPAADVVLQEVVTQRLVEFHQAVLAVPHNVAIYANIDGNRLAAQTYLKNHNLEDSKAKQTSAIAELRQKYPDRFPDTMSRDDVVKWCTDEHAKNVQLFVRTDMDICRRQINFMELQRDRLSGTCVSTVGGGREEEEAMNQPVV